MSGPIEKVLAKAKEQQLELTVGDKVVKNEDHVPKGDTIKTPTLSFPAATEAQTYVVAAIDLDAPFPAFHPLSPILHWLQGGFKSTAGKLESTDAAIAEWHPAQPPPISGPHRYVFMIFEQPEGFDAKKFTPQPEGQPFPMMKRMRWNLGNFVQQAALGEVVAATGFKSN